MKPSSALSKDNAFFDTAKLEQFSIHSRQRNRCYASIGASGFAEVSSASGLNSQDDSRALAATDWDHDGDVDVLMVNRTGPQLRFYMNFLNRGNSVSFRLTGEDSNRDAIGARVEVKLPGVAAPLVKTVQAGGGFMSQSSKRLTFGVGDAKKVESIVVRWPSGKVHHFKQLSVGAMYQLTEGNAEPIEVGSDRYPSIRYASLPGSVRQPLPNERTLFTPRFPLPSPEAQVAAGKWNQLKTSGEQPTIFLFWGQNSESEQVLDQLNRFVGDLEDAKATVVTVFADSSSLRPDEQWEYLSNFAENSPEIKNWTSLSSGGLETMKIVFGHWFGKRELHKTPFALLVDKQMQVVGFYPVEAFRKKQLLNDLRLCGQPPTLADQTSIGGGFWATPVLSVDSRELADRLNRAGFDFAAKQLHASVSFEIANDLKNEAKDFTALGRFDLADQFFEASLHEDPENISALIGRSNLAIDRALAANASELNPGRTSAENMAIAVSAVGLSLPEAKAGFEKVLEIDEKQWQATIGIAKIQLLQDKPSEALKTLVKYQEIHPRVEVLAMQGRVLFQAGRYNKAKSVLEDAYDERPDLPYLAGDLGYLYLIDDDPDGAKQLLREAHRLHPSDFTFLRMLAETEFLTGDLNEAVDLFTQVNQLQPDQLRSKNVLAWLLATSPTDAKRDGVAALALIDTDSEDLTDQDAATLEIYAACYAEVGEFDKAFRFQQLAVKQTNVESNSRVNLRSQLQRLELYRNRKPYRTGRAPDSPMHVYGSQLTDGDFQALRY